MAYAAGDAHPLVVYGANNRIAVAVLSSTGAPATPTTPDTELSIDFASWADATNEYTQATGGAGEGYFDLTGAECSASCVQIRVKSSDQLTTELTVYPTRFSVLESDTAEGGAGSTITLAVATAATNNSFYNGCWVLLTNNSPAGVQYALRRILSYVGSTRVATVDAAWGTNPDNTTTYSILLPPATNVIALGGAKANNGVLPAGSINNAAFAADVGTTAIATNVIGIAAKKGVVDALNVDTYAEPAQGAPPATATFVQRLGYLYKNWRNKKTQTATTFNLFNDDAATVDHKATVSDDATTATKGEIATGP